MATGKRDNVRTTSPDGGATRNISNPDLAARLKAYQSRGKGAKFTAPTEGKPTGNRAKGAQQAKEWGDKKRVSQGRNVNDTKPAIRAGNGNRPAGTVRNPSQSMYGGGQQPAPPRPQQPQQPQGTRPSMFTEPQSPPQGGGYRPSPLVRTQDPLVYAPQGPLSPDGYSIGGYRNEQAGMPPVQPQQPYLPNSPVIGNQGNQGPYAPPQQYQGPMMPQYGEQQPYQPMRPQQGRYMPPPVNPNQQQLTFAQQFNNPWGRKW